jgi:hypothetical protein
MLACWRARKVFSRGGHPSWFESIYLYNIYDARMPLILTPTQWWHRRQVHCCLRSLSTVCMPVCRVCQGMGGQQLVSALGAWGRGLGSRAVSYDSQS